MYALKFILERLKNGEKKRKGSRNESLKYQISNPHLLVHTAVSYQVLYFLNNVSYFEYCVSRPIYSERQASLPTLALSGLYLSPSASVMAHMHGGVQPGLVTQKDSFSKYNMFTYFPCYAKDGELFFVGGLPDSFSKYYF